jgi:hypothetical protein
MQYTCLDSDEASDREAPTLRLVPMITNAQVALRDDGWSDMVPANRNIWVTENREF